MAKQINIDKALGLINEAWVDERVPGRTADPELASVIAEKVAAKLDVLDEAWEMIALAGPMTDAVLALGDKVNGTVFVCPKLPDGWTCSEELNHLGPCTATEL